jgi:ABC-type iron transport system FetAB ATPase subunit
LTVAGQTFTVNQASGCTYTISPTSDTEDSGAGKGNISITAPGGCSWTAASNAAFLTITSGASGSGNGTTTYTIATNTGPQRTGTLTVAGQTFTLTQLSGCVYTIAPTSQSIPLTGGNGTVTVTAGAGCTWTAVSNVPWITITNGASGNGNGTMSYSVASTGSKRSGSMTIAGRTFMVNQP